MHGSHKRNVKVRSLILIKSLSMLTWHWNDTFVSKIKTKACLHCVVLFLKSSYMFWKFCWACSRARMMACSELIAWGLMSFEFEVQVWLQNLFVKQESHGP